MRIGISISGCDMGQSGISRYLIELLRAIAALRTGDRFLLVGTSEALSVFDPHDPAFEPRLLPDAAAGAFTNIWWNVRFLRAFVRAHNIDVLFYPAANRRLPPWAPVPVVGTVHDLSSLHVKGKYPPANEFFIHHVMPRWVRRLDRIVAVSSATKNDMVHSVGIPAERITVIAHGVDLQRFSPAAAAVQAGPTLRKYRIDQPFFVYVSRLEHPGKNHARLIEAFGEFKRATGAPHALVLAGSDWDRAESVHAAAAASPVRDAVRLIGFVSNEDLVGLYGGASAHFFPSLFEGFGMPILESMACGLPVFCSNISALPEVGGGAAQYFDPYDAAAIARALATATDCATLAQMRAVGLERAGRCSWHTAAMLTMSEIYAAAGARDD